MRTLALSLLILSASLALSAHADEGQWVKVSDADGVTVSCRRVEGSGLIAFRGRILLQAPVARVAQVLFDTPRKMEWVSDIREARVLRMISPLEKVEYNHTAAPWPLKDRDFILHASAVIDGCGKTVKLTLHSQDADPELGLYPDRVRGQVDGEYILTAVDGGAATSVLVEIHADPRGWVPKWVVNLFQSKWPRQTLLGIKRQVAKADLTENELVKRAFERPCGGD